MDAQPATPMHAPQSDAAKNKWFGVLAYLGILCLIPLLAAKKSPFAQYHAKQGLVLFLGSIVAGVGFGIIWSFLSGSLYGFYSLLSLAHDLINLAIFILSIIGIINAWKGEMKELPVVGGWAKMFKF